MLSLYQITGLTAIRAGTDMCRDVTIHSRIALLMKLSGLKTDRIGTIWGSFRFAQFAQQIGESCAITGHICADSKGIVRFGTNFSLFRFSQLC